MDFDVKKWIADSTAPGIPPLCSLKLGGKEIAKDVSQLPCSHSETIVDENTIKMESVYTYAAHGLELKLLFKAFTQVGAVDVVLQLTNRQTKRSPIIQDVQVFDSILHPFLPSGTDFAIHRCKGSHAARDDFEPSVIGVKTGKKLRFHPKGGRSSNTDILPFFNVEAKGTGGVFLAVGWSGQWASTIQKDKQGRVWFKLGMERTRLCMEPGESIRSPRLLLFPWRGSRTIDSHNAFRRFFLEYYAPDGAGSSSNSRSLATAFATGGSGVTRPTTSPRRTRRSMPTGWRPSGPRRSGSTRAGSRESGRTAWGRGSCGRMASPTASGRFRTMSSNMA